MNKNEYPYVIIRIQNRTGDQTEIYFFKTYELVEDSSMKSITMTDVLSCIVYPDPTSHVPTDSIDFTNIYINNIKEINTRDKNGACLYDNRYTNTGHVGTNLAINDWCWSFFDLNEAYTTT